MRIRIPYALASLLEGGGFAEGEDGGSVVPNEDQHAAKSKHCTNRSCKQSPAGSGTFLSLNKKVPKEVSKGESVVGLAPAMPVTLPPCPPPDRIAKVAVFSSAVYDRSLS